MITEGAHLRNRYRPKFKSIDPKHLLDVKFDSVTLRPELFENRERKREQNAQYELCSKLSTKLNQSLMTIINEKEYKNLSP